MASTNLVSLTGATGHIGFKTLLVALESGYTVRAAIRSEAKANNLRSHPVVQESESNGRLSFVIVPDFLAEKAFDSALEGVSFVIHVASPIPLKASSSGDLEEAFVKPAVRGTLNLFEAARRVGTIKRIVVTSSTAALVPFNTAFAPSDTVWTAESRLPAIPAPYDNSYVAYTASKIAAFDEAEKWMKEQQPHFDVIHIHPGAVLGRDELNRSTKDFEGGSNWIMLSQVMGVPALPDLMCNYCSVADVAKVHVDALKPNIEGNQSFIVCSSGTDGVEWAQANSIVKKHFRDELEKGVLPVPSSSGTVVCKVDASKTESTFGFKFADFESLVVDVVGHYLEVLEKEQSG